MTDDYFCKLDILFPFMDEIYDELKKAIWYISNTKQCRSDVSINLRNKIQNSIPFQIHCCGFFKNDPGWKYPIHKDSIRSSAINILLVEPCDEFNVFFFSDDFKTKILSPYVRDELLLINTKKFHSVSNDSTDKTRYVLSIGFSKNSYEEIKVKLQNVQS
jgi:hypothetical protein